ncbi:MAG: protein kinase [Firmicutes bacterium]|nr:protein kinase [Bacillota bacterium]
MIGNIINERYKIEKAIGRGGMAVVYKAFDTTLSRQVAIKILHGHFTSNPHFIERFRREAYAAASLVHPNITTIYDTGYMGGVYYIVMEYVRGKTLKQVIDERAPLPIEEAVDIARQVAEAVGHAHSRGIIHRDIKPQNILIADDYIVKVTDFGIARALTMPGLTQTGKILGTARYISPEQAKGRQADHRSDMYSLGLILYEMVAGRPPFDGSSSVEIAGKHVTEKPLRLSELNPTIPMVLDIIVDKLLKKNPDDRYQDIGKLIEDLAFWDPPQKRDLIAALATSSNKENNHPRGGRRSVAGANRLRPDLNQVAGQRPTRKTKPSVKRKLTPFAKISLTAISIFIVGALSYLLLFSGVDEATAGKDAGARTKKSHVQGMQVGELKPVAVVEYNPNGGGEDDLSELNKIVDKDLSTAWSTKSYKTSIFSDPKGGTGVYIDYGRTVNLEAMTIISSGGWSGEIRSSDDALNWTTVRKVDNADKKMTFKFTGEAHKHYMIWIRKLAPLGNGKFGCRIYEVEAYGRTL